MLFHLLSINTQLVRLTLPVDVSKLHRHTKGVTTKPQEHGRYNSVNLENLGVWHWHCSAYDDHHPLVDALRMPPCVGLRAFEALNTNYITDDF